MTMHTRAALAAMLLFTLGSAVVHAQESSVPVYDFTAVEAQSAVLGRMEELEAEVASLRRELAVGGGCGCDAKGCGSCMDGDKLGNGFDGCGPRWEFWTDMTLLRYHKTGGVQTGSDAHTNFNPEKIELGFIASPRFHLRWHRPNGMFIEGTFFQFNHSTIMGADALRVNTYTFDIRFGERFQVNQDWWIEWTGGPRRFRFEESLIDDGGADFNFTRFKGIGGMVSLTAGRAVRRGLFARLLNFEQELFGGAVFAVAHGDQFIRENRALPTDVRLTDVNSIHLEIATGTEWIKRFSNGGELFLRWGVEWVTYTDASTQFSNTAPGLADHELAVQPGADVGFGGFTGTLGFRY